MKRILTLMLGVAFILGAATQSSAVEVQVSGEMDTIFGFSDNSGFSKEDENDHFFARQRYRINVEFIASENLRGVMQFQIGTMEWGNAEDGAQLDTTSASAKIRRAYVDWKVPDTALNVKMGLQYIGLPSAVFGNPFFGANAAGVVVSAGLNDNITLSGIWSRPWKDTSVSLKDNDTDMFAIVADFSYDDFTVSPWFSYTRAGAHSGFWTEGYGPEHPVYWTGETSSAYGLTYDESGRSNIWAGGIALSVSPIDDLEIKFDGMYAKLDNDGRTSTTMAPEADGWLVALAVDYSMDWGTPGAFIWYASGDSKSDQANHKSGRMPILGGDDGFGATRLAFPGAYSAGEDTWVSTSGVGTWGLGFQIADVSFVEDLTHLFRIAYFQGTNHKNAVPDLLTGEGVYMTKRDWAVEVDFDTEYKIYENFSTILELSYIYMDIDNKSGEYRGSNEDENAWNAQVTFSYAF
ncbi:outer membrane homotrimeric porin [Desulfovibrio sp. OttesenSCG-928-C06]|nr:outer membrane homotrimeric porin [Desulfovibrio sp. OttesenSCG-928-C06]